MWIPPLFAFLRHVLPSGSQVAYITTPPINRRCANGAACVASQYNQRPASRVPRHGERRLAAIAQRHNEEYGEAVALALSVLGPGWTP
jgi:hypothetical protein